MTLMIMVEWELTTFLRQDLWLDASPRTCGIASLRAACGVTGNPTAPHFFVFSFLLPFFLKLIVAHRLCVICVREDNDFNV